MVTREVAVVTVISSLALISTKLNQLVSKWDKPKLAITVGY